MKNYPTTHIRNVAILGHSGSGKTSFAEALLFNAKVVDRLGKVNDGNTAMDFDSEETRRKISVNTSWAAFDWQGTKVNLLDTPGDFDFMGEVVEALRVADSSLIILSAKDGMSVGAEKSIRYCNGRDIPYIFVVNKLDEAHTDFYKALQEVKDYAGDAVLPFMLPTVENEKITSFIDVLKREAYKVSANGAAEKMDFPADKEAEVEEIHEILKERIAESSEELMEKFFADEEFTAEEFNDGLNAAIRQGLVKPVYACSATNNEAMQFVLTSALQHLPSPADAPPRDATLADGTKLQLKPNANDPFAAQIFKTIVDPFVGRISLFRVYSGTIKSGDTVFNSNRDKEERVNGLSIMIGKKSQPADSIVAGDLGAMTKLQVTMTGDTLCKKDSPIYLRRIEFPVPSFQQAILPVNKGEEDKIMAGLNRLRDEDPTFDIVNNAETKQMVISGLGAQHIDVLRSKLLAKYKVDSVLADPRVPYREAIRKKVKVQGKHKKQSGGHGQYGDVWIEFEPGETEALTFEQKIFGGSVPKAYHPAVEKGLTEAVEKGTLAGYPLVNLHATLLDGSYHDVDSSEMAFKLAAHIAYKAGIPQANPVILEPISEVKIYVPNDLLGDVMSDVNQRRGRILNIEAKTEVQMVLAEIPTSEMSSYATDLRSMTQGRGWYSIKFARYEQAPQFVQDKVIAEAKALAEEE